MTKPSDHPKLMETLRVLPRGVTRFEVRDDTDRVVGSSPNEQAAIWSAVSAAERMSARGTVVRVISVHDGHEIEEFVSHPSKG